MDNIQLLNEVDAAISAILAGGQSYTIGSRSLTRANLSELIKWKKDLEIQNADSGGCLMPNTCVAYFGAPRG